MFDRLKESNKYFVLRNGKNKKVIVGFLLSVILIGVLATSKMWLPDDRTNYSTGSDYDISFSMDTLHVGNMSVDYWNGLAEIDFSETIRGVQEKEDRLQFSVVDDRGNELPFNLIQGDLTKENEESTISKRNSLLQIGIYEDIYYIEIQIKQPSTETRTVIFDYRNMKEEKITEKTDMYLKTKEKEKNLQSQIEQNTKKNEASSEKKSDTSKDETHETEK